MVVVPAIIPGFRARSPKSVEGAANDIPVMPVTLDAVIGPGAAEGVNGCTCKPDIVTWSCWLVPPLVNLIVIAVLEQPKREVDVISPTTVTLGVGHGVQNCHPFGGTIVTSSIPLAKSLLFVSVITISPKIVHAGAGPQIKPPPEAGVTTTCANPELLTQQKRKAKKNIFEAFIRSEFPLIKAVKNNKESFFIIAKKVFSHLTT